MYGSAASTSCLMNNVHIFDLLSICCVGAVNFEDSAGVDLVPLNRVQTSEPHYTSTAHYVSFISMILILPLEFLLSGKREKTVKNLILGEKNENVYFQTIPYFHTSKVSCSLVLMNWSVACLMSSMTFILPCQKCVIVNFSH